MRGATGGPEREQAARQDSDTEKERHTLGKGEGYTLKQHEHPRKRINAATTPLATLKYTGSWLALLLEM